LSERTRTAAQRCHGTKSSLPGLAVNATRQRSASSQGSLRYVSRLAGEGPRPRFSKPPRTRTASRIKSQCWQSRNNAANSFLAGDVGLKMAFAAARISPTSSARSSTTAIMSSRSPLAEKSFLPRPAKISRLETCRTGNHSGHRPRTHRHGVP